MRQAARRTQKGYAEGGITVGVNTNTYLPSTVETDELVMAIQKLTDADEVKLVRWERTNEWAFRRDDTYFGGPSEQYELYIKREAGFGDGDTSHGGADRK